MFWTIINKSNLPPPKRKNLKMDWIPSVLASTGINFPVEPQFKCRSVYKVLGVKSHYLRFSKIAFLLLSEIHLYLILTNLPLLKSLCSYIWCVSYWYMVTTGSIVSLGVLTRQPNLSKQIFFFFNTTHKKEGSKDALSSFWWGFKTDNRIQVLILLWAPYMTQAIDA